MDIYSFLVKDQKKVEDIFLHIINARSESMRKELVAQLALELIVDANTEQQTFFYELCGIRVDNS